jgi:hypothetical protein
MVPTTLLASLPLQRAPIGHFLRGLEGRPHDVNHSATDSRFVSSLHARTDSTALETAGRQDGQQKGSDDSAVVSSAAVPKLTQARGHDGFLPWAHALTAFTCSLKMGLKVLKGDVLLSEVISEQPSTHDIGYESRQKVSVYSGMDANVRADATAYNNWLILAQRTSDASCKIYLWIFNSVDAPIRKMIVVHAGDGHAASAIISEMFDKPSRMLQQRIVARFYSGRFDAGKGIDILILRSTIHR